MSHHLGHIDVLRKRLARVTNCYSAAVDLIGLIDFESEDDKEKMCSLVYFLHEEVISAQKALAAVVDRACGAAPVIELPLPPERWGFQPPKPEDRDIF